MAEPGDPMRDDAEFHDYVIVGTGVAGIQQLHMLLERTADVIALDANADLGGTWFNNRYPGCRFDSESYSYGYSFSAELLAEWDWKEHFSPQPDNLRYLNFVADKFDLRPHMRFDQRVDAATWDEASRTWNLHSKSGHRYRCRWLLLGVGLLSAHTLPRIAGMETFGGTSFHTYHWPHEPLDLRDKRVGVIGTGATAVQLIGAIAENVGSLHVFQRRPNWCAPLHNRPIDAEEMAAIRARYDEIFAACAATPGAFIHGPVRTPMAESTQEQRLAFWEELYASPGFGIWLGNYREVLMDETANAEFSAFVADKIRQRVHDPAVAEKLIPKDHGFGVQRVPMETRYYEAYNLAHVRLVDIAETPITSITPTGIATSAEQIDLDVIVYATGFDGVTGAFDRIAITGTDGQRLADRWHDGPRTYLGLLVTGFPNLIMLGGPQAASAGTNYPRAIDDVVRWTTTLTEHLESEGATRFECTADAEDEWETTIRDLTSMLLLRNAKSWFTGYNENVEGHDTMRYLLYNGGAPRYRKRITQVATDGYTGIAIS